VEGVEGQRRLLLLETLLAGTALGVLVALGSLLTAPQEETHRPAPRQTAVLVLTLGLEDQALVVLVVLEEQHPLFQAQIFAWQKLICFAEHHF
jgi:hypothetical protein